MSYMDITTGITMNIKKHNITPSPFRERGLSMCRAKKEEERTRSRSPFLIPIQDPDILQTVSSSLFLKDVLHLHHSTDHTRHTICYILSIVGAKKGEA